jgi:hypothetical protein
MQGENGSATILNGLRVNHVRTAASGDTHYISLALIVYHQLVRDCRQRP